MPTADTPAAPLPLELSLSRVLPAPPVQEPPSPVLKTLRTLFVGCLAGAVVATCVSLVADRASGVSGPTAYAASARTTVARATNPVTPGDFTGLGFDQCLTPPQWQMDRWLQHSPFLAVGIYISGNSRFCRSQPNLTPAWISNQLAKGWRLLPITLGPQASCQPRFPRYDDDPSIIANPGPHGLYGPAAKQGRAEAEKAVATADALGIVAGSTLWYDLEGFDSATAACRESALRFLSAWTARLHQLKYVSGVYSSAGSGIKILDDARTDRPDAFHLPDQIWLARWDGRADTRTSYISDRGWQPHRRVKQFQGGHDETWGRVRINIDRNFLDLGRGTVSTPEDHCDGTRVSFPDYPLVGPDRGSDYKLVRGLKCLLTEQGVFDGPLDGGYGKGLVAAVRAWRSQHGLADVDTFTRKAWMTLLATGGRPALKGGSGGLDVTRLQRSLNATGAATQVTVSGVFGPLTDAAVRAYQTAHDLEVTGVAGYPTWKALQSGVL